MAEPLRYLVAEHLRPWAARGGRAAEVFQRYARMRPLLKGLRERRKGSKQDGDRGGDSQHGNSRAA